MVLAASSALLMPSLEDASILGAPARIATPMPDAARTTRLSATSLPLLDELSDLRRRQEYEVGGLAGADAFGDIVDAVPNDRDLVPGRPFEFRHKAVRNFAHAR